MGGLPTKVGILTTVAEIVTQMGKKWKKRHLTEKIGIIKQDRYGCQFALRNHHFQEISRGTLSNSVPWPRGRLMRVHVKFHPGMCVLSCILYHCNTCLRLCIHLEYIRYVHIIASPHCFYTYFLFFQLRFWPIHHFAQEELNGCIFSLSRAQQTAGQMLRAPKRRRKAVHVPGGHDVVLGAPSMGFRLYQHIEEGCV